MSQKRKSEAAALTKRIAAIAGRVLDFGFDAGAMAVIFNLSLCAGAEHECGEQQGQVNDADFEQVACQHAALGIGGCTQNAAEPNRVAQDRKSTRLNSSHLG